MWIAVYNQSTIVTCMPVRHCKTISDAPHFYESYYTTNKSTFVIEFLLCLTSYFPQLIPKCKVWT